MADRDISQAPAGSAPPASDETVESQATAESQALGGLRLDRDRFGRLVAIIDGVRHEHAVPVRAFPIAAPGESISLLGADGHELAWIPRLDGLPAHERELLAEELESRDFTPEIRRIRGVSGYVTPCIWRVDTDRGTTAFTLRSEESIRRLPGGGLLIADSQGIHYLIRNPGSLEMKSRKVLDRFL